jgi:hypothetical protein
MRTIFTWLRKLLLGSYRSSALRSGRSAVAVGTGPKKCYEILLPLTHNDGRPVDPRLFLQTHDELLALFGAVSFIPQTVRGTWVHDGERYRDECRRIFVDVDDSIANREFFLEYKHTLEARFNQIVIYIRSYPVDIL